MKHIIVIASLSYIALGTSQAALTLTLHENSPNRLSFSVGGSFDLDVDGNALTNVLALRADWSAGADISNDWINDAIGGANYNAIAGLTVVEDTISFSAGTIESKGIIAVSSLPGGQPITYGDAISWSLDTVPIVAGTSVSGKLTLESVAGFDFSEVTQLQLVSGLQSEPSGIAFRRLEASATLVPEPTSFIYVFVGLVGLVFSRKK